MKIPGYCIACRRIRLVNVTAFFGTTVTPAGTCDECRDKQDDKH